MCSSIYTMFNIHIHSKFIVYLFFFPFHLIFISWYINSRELSFVIWLNHKSPATSCLMALISASHITISEGRLLLRCLWKVGLTLQSKAGNHSHPEMILGARNIPQPAQLKLMILYTWVVKDILHHNKEGLFFMVGSEKTMEIHKQGNEIIGFLLNLFTLVIKLWIK